MKHASNVFLVGLMGAGKTTVGRHLARRLSKEFLDTDHEIETRTGVRVAVIFEIEGESGFRRREAETLSRLVETSNIVLATGVCLESPEWSVQAHAVRVSDGQVQVALA